MVFTLILVANNTSKIEEIEIRTNIIYREISYVASLAADQKRELEGLILSTND